MSGYTKAALLCSNYYIVPMKIDYLSLFGLPLLQNYIQNLGSEYEASIAFSGIVLTMTRPDHRIYRSLKEKINNNSEWKKNLFNAELKHKIIIANALSPDNGNSENAFIYNLGDIELKNQIINITTEFMQKIRL